MMNNLRLAAAWCCLAGLPALHGAAMTGPDTTRNPYTIDRCVNAFTPAHIESTKAGYQYWFADKKFLDGRTLKMSVVRPHSATHPPHAHEEDEFFFVLEGTAEFFLAGETRTVSPYTSLYCPPNVEHGIRNVGDSELKYLVIKKYPLAQAEGQGTPDTVSVAEFYDSAHHWYDIQDEEREIAPEPNQRRYDRNDVAHIADNILLYQKSNGGWPKNYDMRAILSDGQRRILAQNTHSRSTTFDNGATHSQVQYLAGAYAAIRDPRYRDACLRGIDFMLEAQLPNGGWQQFHPDTTGYRRYITFNDGAMTGVMKVMQRIVEGSPEYAFLDSCRRGKARTAFAKGLECIVRCQVRTGGERTAWCQQHDNHDFRPRPARTFEPVAIASLESADIVLFLMSVSDPTPEVIAAVQGAVRWFERSRVFGVRLKEIRAERTRFMYHESDRDRILVTDPSAPPLWARYYDIGANVPLFCNRDGKTVSALSEVERERRTGYAWYTEHPADIFGRYPAWQQRHAPGASVLGMQTSPGASTPPADTSFSTWSAWQKILAQHPQSRPADVAPSPAVLEHMNIVYTAYGYRHLSLDLFTPADPGPGPSPGVIIIHGGGWRSGNRAMETPMARALALRGYAAALVEYRLSPEAHFPAAVRDLKAAIRWVRAHAREYGIDSSRIAVMGGSAGGSLAALLGTTGDMKEFEGIGTHAQYSTRVQAIIDIDGVVDFTDSAESGKDADPAKPSAGKLWFGAAYRDRPELWKQASALNWVNAATPPVLFINSSLDRFHAGRDPMRAKLEALGVMCEVHSLPDTPHPFWLMDPWFDKTSRLVAGFLNRVLKQR